VTARTANAFGAALVAALVALLAIGCGTGSSGSLAPIGAGLNGPAGLEATVYTTGLKHASAFAFDRRGRPWIATSGATSHSADALYLVRRRGSHPVEVVSALRAPLGLIWYRNTLYVSEIGRVEAFTGLRGMRFATRKTILDGPVSGASNGGLSLSPDGRILMAVSTTCDHCTPTSKWEAAVVSFRPDGSDLRLHATGIRAGFGLASVPGTNELLVSMNQRDDLGEKTPGDWLAVVKQGEDWGFPACYGQGGTACTGVPTPLAVLDAHAAAGGVAVLTGALETVLGKAALVAEWQTGVVKEADLEGSGTTAWTVLTGLSNPLPLVATRDGAVLVGDWSTGVVYRIAAT
jgi:glucose/arabinose dehydrogenase